MKFYSSQGDRKQQRDQSEPLYGTTRIRFGQDNKFFLVIKILFTVAFFAVFFYLNSQDKWYLIFEWWVKQNPFLEIKEFSLMTAVFL